MPITTAKRTGINNIPPEILGEIFFRCLPIDSWNTSQDAQRLLSAICRLWRTVVLATPALWATFDIAYVDVLWPPLEIIRIHLQRSGTHPLSFRLDAASPKHFYSPKPNLLPVLKELVAASRRWCKVNMTLVRITKDILDLITLGDVPLLQSIRCDVLLPHGLPIPLHMLERCPHLESFHWGSPTSSLLLPLESTRLTSLLLQTSLSVFECVTLLRLSPRLRNAVFYGLDSDPSPTPRLTHLALCALTAVGEHPDTLMDALTLPALLDLDLMIRHAEWDTELSAFLMRSKPTLHRLSLSFAQMQGVEPALLRTLTLTPHVHNLMLSTGGARQDPPLTAVLVRALHPPPPPGTPLCPRLQRLNLSGISDCPDGWCSAMLRARWGASANANGVACLEWARIQLKDDVGDRDQADIEELCTEGMQVMLNIQWPRAG